jgi:hypothetical protein
MRQQLTATSRAIVATLERPDAPKVAVIDPSRQCGSTRSTARRAR